MTVLFLADRRLERDRLLGDLDDLPHPLGRHLHHLADLLGGGLPPEFLEELAGNPDQLVDRLNHVDGNANGPRLVGQRPSDGLPDPPGRVRAELVPLAPVELLDGPDQPEVPFLNQVQEQHAAADVLLGDADDEAQVGLDQAALRLLVPPLHSLGQLDLIGRVEQRDLADLLEVHPDRIIDADPFEGLEHGLGLFLVVGPLLGLLRVVDHLDLEIDKDPVDAVVLVEVVLDLRHGVLDLVKGNVPALPALFDQLPQLRGERAERFLGVRPPLRRGSRLDAGCRLSLTGPGH